MNAITFRRQKTKRLKDFDNVELSILSNSAVLQKAK